MPGQTRTLPQPPIVWGPSEVNEWIRGAYPAEGRSGRGGRKHAERVAGLAAKVWSDSMESVRGRTAEALVAVGFSVTASRGSDLAASKADRRIRVKFRKSLISDSISVIAHFEPPVHLSTVRKILQGLTDSFPLAEVTLRRV